MSLKPEVTNRFKKDLKRIQKRGKNTEKLFKLMDLLLEEEDLPEQYKNHPLIGDYIGHFDCHIEPDWLLIYAIEKDVIRFVRTGSHSDLFK